MIRTDYGIGKSCVIRMREATRRVIERGEYPSITRISLEMGRESGGMAGHELRTRRAILAELNIDKIRTGAPEGNTNWRGNHVTGDD